MNTPDLMAIANHVWQSTAFADLAVILSLAFRNNRARVRYVIWLLASCKFLVPLSALVALGGLVRWRTVVESASSNVTIFVETTRRFATPVVLPQLHAAASPSWIPAVLFANWACGFVGIACAWFVQWRRIRAMVRSGSPAEAHSLIPAICSPAQAEPGVSGIFRPVLILPEGICESLTPEQLNAVVAHDVPRPAPL